MAGSRLNILTIISKILHKSHTKKPLTDRYGDFSEGKKVRRMDH